MMDGGGHRRGRLAVAGGVGGGRRLGAWCSGLGAPVGGAGGRWRRASRQTEVAGGTWRAWAGGGGQWGQVAAGNGGRPLGTSGAPAGGGLRRRAVACGGGRRRKRELGAHVYSD
ncbi:hypothetical protein GUJ93_ZPchr0004g38176 [Zizania palustris]|uniref:Uncharacterized protein n=1 Tax=Zizania palustris TaxID=103762 RepID=A0A8J5V916_ZIZPA|nr:hypothetical protein GUJ93_ZPchr0004g38176 [Zizania palustris]